VFAPPVYIYIVSLAALIGYGLYRSFFGDLGPMPLAADELSALALDHGTATDDQGDPIFIIRICCYYYTLYLLHSLFTCNLFLILTCYPKLLRIGWVETIRDPT
jgi:hypothetical protein